MKRVITHGMHVCLQQSNGLPQGLTDVETHHCEPDLNYSHHLRVSHKSHFCSNTKVTSVRYKGKATVLLNVIAASNDFITCEVQYAVHE